jgi:hypothetical protein
MRKYAAATAIAIALNITMLTRNSKRAAKVTCRTGGEL